MTKEEAEAVFSLICDKNSCENCIMGTENELCIRDLDENDGDTLTAIIPKVIEQYESNRIRAFLASFIKGRVV